MKDGVKSAKELHMKKAGLSFGDARFSYLCCAIVETVPFTPFP